MFLAIFLKPLIADKKTPDLLGHLSYMYTLVELLICILVIKKINVFCMIS